MSEKRRQALWMYEGARNALAMLIREFDNRAAQNMGIIERGILEAVSKCIRSYLPVLKRNHDIEIDAIEKEELGR